MRPWTTNLHTQLVCDKSCLLEVLLGRQDPGDHLIDGHGHTVLQALAEGHIEPSHQSRGGRRADLGHTAAGLVEEDLVLGCVGVFLTTLLVLGGQIARCKRM